MTDPTVLSISSQVAYGHVGNAAAVPALQALGCEVLAVPTVLLAHHPGHGPPAGMAFPAEQVAGVLAGIEGIGALHRLSGVLTGYMGTADTVAAAADAVARCRGREPRPVYLCDPVIGDGGRVYVRDGVEQAIRERLLPQADVITPNHFELERLAGVPVNTEAEAIAAARRLIDCGPGLVVVTSLRTRDSDPVAVETMLVSRDRAWIAATPRLGKVPQGSGDLLAALFLGHLVLGLAPANALARAVSAVYAVLASSAGLPEMRLVAGRNNLAAPPPLALRPPAHDALA